MLIMILNKGGTDTDIENDFFNPMQVWTVHCLNREKFATGEKTTRYYLRATTRQNCAACSRKFFRRA